MLLFNEKLNNNMDLSLVIILNERDKLINAPAVGNFTKICRVCLNNITEPNAYKNIYEEECKMSIKTLLETYAYAKISETEDSLPQNVCSICIDFLIEVHTFRSRCKVNENLLMKLRKEAEAVLLQHSYANILPSNSKTNNGDFENFAEGQFYEQINDERMGLIKCKDCHLMFSGKEDMNAHRKEAKHSQIPGSPCPHCGRLFNSTKLAEHIRSHNDKMPFVCSHKSNMQRHMDTHTAEREYICEMCGISVTNLSSLKEHQIMHHAVKKKALVCPECKKVYNSEYQLRMHLKCHTKRYFCSDCGKTLSSKTSLAKHVRVHAGDKPFRCSKCKRGFAHSLSLRMHMDSHAEELIYSCNQCEKQFVERADFILHKQIHNTRKTPRKCTICNKSFSTSYNLRRHSFQIHNKVNKQPDGQEQNDEIVEREEYEVAVDMLDAELGAECDITGDGYIIEEYHEGDEKVEEGDTTVYYEDVDDVDENEITFIF